MHRAAICASPALEVQSVPPSMRAISQMTTPCTKESHARCSSDKFWGSLGAAAATRFIAFTLMVKPLRSLPNVAIPLPDTSVAYSTFVGNARWTHITPWKRGSGDAPYRGRTLVVRDGSRICGHRRYNGGAPH